MARTAAATGLVTLALVAQRLRGGGIHLQAAWTAELGRGGPVSSIGAPVSEPAGPGMVVVKIPVTFEHGELTVIVSVHDAGWITGIQLAPASAAQPTGPRWSSCSATAWAAP
ncbi:MAG: hypothetical protein ACRDRO_12260 [Pseudonocardiaceae bacterium]